MCSVINNNNDILFTMLCNLSSYKRSKVCTVCKLWNTTIGRVISLIENSPGLSDMFKRQHYHSIIRLLKYTYNSEMGNENGMYGTYKRVIGQHMWNVNTPMFVKLWLNINNNAISWSSSMVFEVVERGYDKLFYWMQKTNHNKNPCWSESADLTYTQASLRLAIILKNPDLITEKNIPNYFGIKLHIFDDKVDACCLDKVLGLVKFTAFDMMNRFIEIGALRHANSLMCTLMDKILRDFPGDAEYDSYQDILDQFYPNVIVYEGDINDFRDVEFELFGQNLKGCIIPELIEACRNNSISDKLYKNIHRSYSESRYDMLAFYCGIMASNYNEDVIYKLNENMFDTVPILKAACRYRHNKMIRIIVDYVRNQCS